MMDDQAVKEKQEYSCYTPWQVYGIGWSVRPDRPYRLALGSFVEKGTNAIRVVQLNPVCFPFDFRRFLFCVSCICSFFKKTFVTHTGRRV